MLVIGSIAVGGFIAHAGPVLAGDSEEEIRKATVSGGLTGLRLWLFVVVLSAMIAVIA
jgi:hypothetical protein